MLGKEILSQHDRDSTLKFVGVDRKYFDVGVLDSINEVFTTLKPDIVIHTAAYTNVDGCETNKEKAYKINHIGTKNVALVCERLGIRLIYISTDYVFDGKKKEPYKEDDSTNPLNVYGDSKLKGEDEIQNILEDFIVVRTSWLYGREGNNFVKTILRLLDEKEIIEVADDQIGTPTYTKDLASALIRLLKIDYKGILHLTNSGLCSWFHFAKKINELAKKGKKIVPITGEQLGRPAVRPMYSVLDNSKASSLLNGYLRTWDDAITEFFCDNY